jgi:hypothetical protein
MHVGSVGEGFHEVNSLDELTIADATISVEVYS